MPCYSPLRAYYSRDLNPTGKRSLVFSINQAYDGDPLDIPCGQCIGCRLERSRNWAVRCLHEASLHEHNSFLTLTYSPENLPEDGSLVKKHYQDFMKRLRKDVSSKALSPINPYLTNLNNNLRYFHCGEYGELKKRPHYHSILFNLNFNDKQIIKKSNHHEHILYKSETLSKIWTYGHASIGSVTFDSAAYVARYITKKKTGKGSWKHYIKINHKGEILEDLLPEYTTMSRRPAIGKEWLQKYSTDVFPLDYVVINGKKTRVPKYYDKVLEGLSPEMLEDIKERRKQSCKIHNPNNTPSRLLTREKIKEDLIKQTLKRNYETC